LFFHFNLAREIAVLCLIDYDAALIQIDVADRQFSVSARQVDSMSMNVEAFYVEITEKKV
jgi:hypothetical protein